MSFLHQFAEENEEETDQKTFIVSKKKMIKRPMEIYDQELERSELDENELNRNKSYFSISFRNVFQFNPGSRWGQSRGNRNNLDSTEANFAEVTENEMCKNDLSGEKKFNLRGPREGKKSGSNKPVDEKKLSLAKSLFGKKKK
jgi:hypothetical protein